MVYERFDGVGGAASRSTLSPKEFHEVDERMQHRLEYLEKQCNVFGLDKPG